MSSGVSRIRTGAFTGTGVLINIRRVGFRPRKVELISQGGLAKAVWTDTMPDDSMAVTVTAGTMTFVVADAIIPLSSGFSIGTDTDLNVSGELVHWVAYE